LYSHQIEHYREHEKRYCSGEQGVLAREGLLVGECFRREVLEQDIFEVLVITGCAGVEPGMGEWGGVV
jgi:hypothetical protein